MERKEKELNAFIKVVLDRHFAYEGLYTISILARSGPYECFNRFVSVEDYDNYEVALEKFKEMTQV